MCAAVTLGASSLSWEAGNHETVDDSTVVARHCREVDTNRRYNACCQWIVPRQGILGVGSRQ